METFIGKLLDALKNALLDVVDLLPKSPIQFDDVPTEVQQLLGILNWFIPVGAFVRILGVWLVAIAVWYGVSVILRWAKAIE